MNTNTRAKLRSDPPIEGMSRTRDRERLTAETGGAVGVRPWQAPRIAVEQTAKWAHMGALRWHTNPPGGGDWRGRRGRETDAKSAFQLPERLLRALREKAAASSVPPKSTLHCHCLLGQSAALPDGAEVSVERAEDSKCPCYIVHFPRYIVHSYGA